MIPEVKTYENLYNVSPQKPEEMKRHHFSAETAGYRTDPAVFVWNNLRTGSTGRESDHIVRTVIMYTYKRDSARDVNPEWKFGLGIDYITLDVYEIPIRRKEFFMVIRAGSSAGYAVEDMQRQVLLRNTILQAILETMDSASAKAKFDRVPAIMSSTAVATTTEPAVFVVNMVLRTRGVEDAKLYTIDQRSFFEHNDRVFEAVRRAGFITVCKDRDYVWRRVIMNQSMLDAQNHMSDNDRALWLAIDTAITAAEQVQMHANVLTDDEIEEEADIVRREAFCTILTLMGYQIHERADSSDEQDMLEGEATSETETEDDDDADIFGISDEEYRDDPMFDVTATYIDEEKNADARKPEGPILRLPVGMTLDDPEVRTGVGPDEHLTARMIRTASHGSTDLFVFPRSLEGTKHDALPLDSNELYAAAYEDATVKSPAFSKLLDTLLRLSLEDTAMTRDTVLANLGDPMASSVAAYNNAVFNVADILDDVQPGVAVRITRWLEGHKLIATNLSYASMAELTHFVLLILALRSAIRGRAEKKLSNKEKCNLSTYDASLYEVEPFTGILRRGDMPKYKSGRLVIPDDKLPPSMARTLRLKDYPR